MLCATLSAGCGKRTTFVMPTGSMSPTIPRNSRLTVDTNTYASVSAVGRWDIVVFHHYTKRQAAAPFVKRVVGLPGETISFTASDIIVNGMPLVFPAEIPTNFKGFTGLAFRFVDTSGGTYTIPSGSFFVVGDNAQHSRDSRTDGPIQFSNVVGKVIKIVPPK